jgi:hypothetical protein
MAYSPVPWLQGAQQQNDQQQQEALYRAYLEQMQQNAGQGVSNANQQASFNSQYANQQYNLAGDLANQQRQLASMYGDQLNLQQRNYQFGQNMQQDVLRGQTNLLQQQQANNRYQWGADEDLARTAYQRSMNEVPSGFQQAMGQFGYR